MRVTAKVDVAAPLVRVFAAATDHEGFERRALRRGAEVRRTDRPGRLQPGSIQPGACWEASFGFRGRLRRVEVTLARLEPPTVAEALVEGGGFAARVGVDCLALSRGTTRLTLVVDAHARTLPARLVLQGLRLARGGIERRARERLEAWAVEVERRERRLSPGGLGGQGLGGLGLTDPGA